MPRFFACKSFPRSNKWKPVDHYQPNHNKNMCDLMFPKRDLRSEPCQCVRREEIREVEDLLYDLVEDAKYLAEDILFLRRSLVELHTFNDHDTIRYLPTSHRAPPTAKW
jgi:hypothetical protein